jgi:hypothetical protein
MPGSRPGRSFGRMTNHTKPTLVIGGTGKTGRRVAERERRSRDLRPDRAQAGRKRDQLARPLPAAFAAVGERQIEYAAAAH